MARKRGGLAGVLSALVLPSIFASFAPPRFCASLRPSHDGVLLVKWVAFGTVGLYAVVQASITASDIFLLRHGFQMSRVETRSIPAQMVDVQSIWDRPVQQLVGQSVSVKPFRLFINTDTDNAVPIALGSRPVPALIRLIDKGQQPLVKIHAFDRHV